MGIMGEKMTLPHFWNNVDRHMFSSERLEKRVVVCFDGRIKVYTILLAHPCKILAVLVQYNAVHQKDECVVEKEE